MDWWNKDFVDYVLFKIRNFSSVKQGTEFSRKVSIKNKNDVAFVVINKKMARYFYSIFNDKKMMYGTAKAKAQDDLYRDYAISLNEVLKKNGVSRLLDENEKDYVELVTIPTNSFYALLPQIAMFGKTFFTDGIEFETDRHYRSIVAGTPVYQTAKSIKEADKVRQKNPLGTRARLLAYKEAQPLAKGEQPKDYVPSLTETRPEDYILAQIIGADSRSYGGIFNCYFPKNPSDMRRGEMDSRVSKVQLTIDSHLQNFVEMKLRERGKEIGAEKGIALVQDVNSGELLAAATYNPEWLNGNPLDMLTFSYQPGSTFKPLSVAIALESGLVRETDLFDIQNEHKEHTDPYGCGKDAKKKSEWCKISDDHPMPAGKANMAEIIAASSNLGTSLIADRLWDKEINDPSKIAGTPWDSSEYKPLGQQYAEYMRSLFGIGSKTGLGQDLCVSESAGRNISLERKQNSNATYNYLDYLKDSYGQGPVEVTPVQLISAYSALVNGGTLYKPQIVKEIQYSNGQTDVIKPQKVMENIISQKTSDLVKGYMKSVFEENVGCKKDSNGKTSCSTELSKSVQGTGRGYRINGFDWGGKTGTADKMACPKGKICYTYQCSDIEDEHEKEICMAACPKNVGCNQSKCAKLYPVDKDKKNPANKEDRQICENMVSSYDFIRIFKNKKEGKTVRARKRPDGFTDVSPNRASFAGFLPYNDPKYAILVVFDESEWASEEESIHPQGAGAAGPVLQAIAKELIADMKKNDSPSETR